MSPVPCSMRSWSQSVRSCSSRVSRSPVVIDASPAPGVDQQHERQQAEHLRLVGHEAGEEVAEPDRLVAEAAAQEGLPGRGEVALVEDEVDNGQHACEAVRHGVLRRHLVRNAGVSDLGPGARKAFGHGLGADEERPGDLGRIEAGNGAQREGNLRSRGRGPGGSR